MKPRAIQPLARRIRDEGDVRTLGRASLDVRDEPLHDAATQALALVSGIGGDVGDMEVPTAVADHSAHRDDGTTRIHDVARGPAARDGTGALVRGLRRQAGVLSQSEVVGQGRCFADQ